MNTLYLPPSSNDFQLNYHSNSLFFEDNPHLLDYKLNPDFSGHDFSLPISEQQQQEVEVEVEVEEVYDDQDTTLKFISQMLMEEEDLLNKQPCMLHDCLALQATEKSLYDVLINNNQNPSHHQNADSPNNHFTKTFNTTHSQCTSGVSSSDIDIASFLDSNSIPEGDFVESLMIPPYSSLLQNPTFLPDFAVYNGQLDLNSSAASIGETTTHDLFINQEFLSSNSGQTDKKVIDYQPILEINKRDPSPDNLREKRNRYGEEGDLVEELHKSNKQLAHNVNESESIESLEMYDKALLCSNTCETDATKQNGRSKGSKGGRSRGGGKKQSNIKEIVDLRSLLTQCAQAVASYDTKTVTTLLIRLRQHSSPLGDGTERVAHYFANALEARMAGTGPASYVGCFSSRISASVILKAYTVYINACPFQKLSNMLANKTISKLTNGATTLHIIDFGILYGFQWPCLIQTLSERPGGPPKLRITGIDFPQPGFRPAERVEETGNRLRRYCERFGVPFEYNAIAQKWETINMEQLKIEKNELLVVNSLYRLQNVPDETVVVNCPRDAVLNLIKKINPNMFIHGVINGTYNTPFFITRFREALFHFSSMFDMFEATIPREDEHRVLFEREVIGKDAMNIIACEGTERVDRPETYKQWQVRNLRAGFRQLSLNQEFVKIARNKVRMDYHRDFSVDEDGKWMLQGWKGRVLYALSCWQPNQN